MKAVCRDIHVPTLLVYKQNIKKISPPAQGTAPQDFAPDARQFRFCNSDFDGVQRENVIDLRWGLW